jgi:hypothetical protein
MMKSKRKIVRFLGVLIFSVGVLLGLVLSGVAVWGDLEAHWFDAQLSQLRDASLKTMRCPVMITANETGTVSASFKNPLERPSMFMVRAHISQYLTLMREENTQLHIEPGERKSLEWTVTADDVLHGNLIFVKVLQFRKYPIPGRLGSCGILVVDLPYLTGTQLTVLTFVASLLCMAFGVGLWIVSNQPLRGRGREAVGAMGALAASVLVGIIVSLLGLWMVGLLIFVITLLVIGAIIGHFWRRRPDQ